MQLTIIEVVNLKQQKQFNQLTRNLYANDQVYISHLDHDINAIFDPNKNSEFKSGQAKRWIVLNNNKGVGVGKVAAFYNNKQSGIGFFDCIDNQEVANLLFDTASEWLKQNNQTSVEAPVNFGERDKYWGLLVEGFKNPSYQEPYNFPYYQKLFENYGFEKHFEQTTSEAMPENVDMARLQRLAERSQRNNGLEAKHFEFSEMEKYVKAFTDIYNRAWNHQEFYVPLTEDRVTKLFKSMKPILREDIMWFMFDGDKPIAFYISIIDVNQIFKYVNGSMNWWGKLKFLWYRSRVKIDRIRGIIFGVIPEYQNKGAFSSMLVKMHEVIMKDPYLKSTELAWIGDFNPKMQALFKSMNTKKTKLHITFKKLL